MSEADVDVMEPVVETSMEEGEADAVNQLERRDLEPQHDARPPPREEEFTEGVIEDGFGHLEDPDGLVRPVKRFTFTNKNGMTAQVINFGVTVTSIRVPDRKGVFDDVALGFDKFDDYVRYRSAYIGSTIGRVCNRVSRGMFVLGSRVFDLTKNVADRWQLHGGHTGLSFLLWKTHVDGKRVVFSHLSADGYEGYPGNLLLQVAVWLTDDNGLKMVSSATTDSPTPVNLTNHAYFNLGGHWSGAQGVGEHIVVVNADKYLVCDDDMVPTGEIKHVATPDYFDLRIPKLLSRLIPVIPKGGFDLNYRINGGKEDGVRFVGRLIHPPTGRVMEVFSDQPCAVLYTSRNLPKPDETEEVLPGDDDYLSEGSFESLGDEGEPKPPQTRKKQVVGKNGVLYEQYGGVCIEPQGYPDAVNKPHFPPVIVYPGQTYRNVIVYKFGTLVRTKTVRAEAEANGPDEVPPDGSRGSGSRRGSDGSRSRHSGDSRTSQRSAERTYSGDVPTRNYSDEDRPGRQVGYREPEEYVEED